LRRRTAFASKFNLGSLERLQYDCQCALYKVVPVHGRLYVSQNFICFYCKVFNSETKETIAFKDVTSITKKQKPVFLSGIEICTEENTYFFSSFVSRSKTFLKLIEIWQSYTEQKKTTTCATQNAPPTIITTTTPITTTTTPATANSSSVITPSVQTQSATSEPTRYDNPTEVWAHELEDDLLLKAESFIACNLTELFQVDLPISVKTFFDYFYCNGTRFTHIFHQDHGDTDLVVADWATHPIFGTVREKRYVVPTNAPIGPAFSRAEETQCYYINANKQLIIQTISIMLDIPYGDYFRVEAKWEVTPRDGGCSLTVSSGVNFLKKTLMKGRIESTAVRQTKETYLRWVSIAKDYISQKNSPQPPLPTTAAATTTTSSTETTTQQGSTRGAEVSTIITTTTTTTQQAQQQSRTASRDAYKLPLITASNNTFIFLFILVAYLFFKVHSLQSQLNSLNKN